MWGYPPGCCVCVDAVHRLSVGRNQDCVPACCMFLTYELHYLYWGMIGTYIYGRSSGLQGPFRVSRVLPVV